MALSVKKQFFANNFGFDEKLVTTALIPYKFQRERCVPIGVTKP